WRKRASLAARSMLPLARMVTTSSAMRWMRALPSSLESARAVGANGIASMPARSSACARRRDSTVIGSSPCRKARSRARGRLFVLSGQRRLLDLAVGNLGFAALPVKAAHRGVEIERSAAELVDRLDQARALVHFVDDAGHDLEIRPARGQVVADRIRER